MTENTGLESMADAISEEAHSDSLKETSAEGKWPSALLSLLTARLAIVSAEGRAASAVAARKIMWLAIAGIGLLLCWVIGIAAMIGLAAELTALSWYHVGFIVALIHLLIAIFGFSQLKKKTIPSFPVTRSEFDKDRIWLTNVKNQSTSKS